MTTTRAQVQLDVKEMRFPPCIARQAILTADKEVCGYELLFREGKEEYFFGSDAEGATRSTLNTSVLVGLDVLGDGHPAFINFTRDILQKEYVRLFPKEQIVVEILETVAGDEAMKWSCQRLKHAGYKIALDDFVPGDSRESLVPFSDFIKVDFKAVALADSARLANVHGKTCKMVAEKVETQEDFNAARKAGFTHFQGYFFRRPERLKTRQIPANQATYLRLLQAVSKTDVDLREVEDLIKHEASLCYQLLRYMNSPRFGLFSSVQSIGHAATMLGERELCRWIRLAVTLVIGQDSSSDLVLSSLVRARFCELIGPRVEHGKSDLFLMGILSLMDVILEEPMGVILHHISIDPDTKAQLLDKESPLSPIYELMLAREDGDWAKVATLIAELKLPADFVTDSYNDAMIWARQYTRQM